MTEEDRLIPLRRAAVLFQTRESNREASTMSNVPLARTIIEEVLLTDTISAVGRRQLRRALRLMRRVPYCRRAPSKRKVIDKYLRRRVKMLMDNTDMTMHEIANKVGLRSSGRISEVAHGKR